MSRSQGIGDAHTTFGAIGRGTRGGVQYETWMKYFHYQPDFDVIVNIHKEYLVAKEKVAFMERTITEGLPSERVVMIDLEAKRDRNYEQQMCQAYYNALEVYNLNPAEFRRWQYNYGIEPSDQPNLMEEMEKDLNEVRTESRDYSKEAQAAQVFKTNTPRPAPTSRGDLGRTETEQSIPSTKRSVGEGPTSAD